MQADTLEKPNAADASELVAKAKLPDESLLKRQADAFLAMVDTYIIDSPDTLQSAADDRNSINDKHKAIEAQRQFLKAPSLEQGRRIDNFFSPVLTTLEKARKALDAKIAAFTEKQRADREAAERKAREEAELEARRQREAAAKVEAEARAKAEALRKEAEEAAAAGRAGQAAKLQERASSVESAGQEKAAGLNLAAEQTKAMPLPVTTTVAKATGIAMQYDYSGKCFDTLALMRHVVEKRTDLVALFEIKESALNGQARSLKEALDLPGVTLVKKPRISDKR